MFKFIKKLWETGETISADKLNRMEEGIEEALTETGKKAAGSGWGADKYLGTDASGNVAVKDLPTPDTTLSEAGKPADAKTTGDKIAAIPCQVAADGYTDITGTRQSCGGKVVKSGNTITINHNLQGGVAEVIVIEMDDNECATKITANGVGGQWEWEGFDDE